jgi:hypothetical protein
MPLETSGAVDGDDERIISTELSAGEKLFWVGHPRRGPGFGASDLVAVPFSIVWLGVVILGVRRTIEQKVPLEEFPLFFLAIFLLVGLYFVVGRFLVDAARRRKTTYGLTDTRLILVSGFFTRRVQSIDLASLGTISLSERRDGSGTIILKSPLDPRARTALVLGTTWPQARPYLPPMLEAIENARAVYEKIGAIKDHRPRAE